MIQSDLQIIGDEIWFLGEVVAKIPPKVTPTVREEFEELLYKRWIRGLNDASK